MTNVGSTTSVGRPYESCKAHLTQKPNRVDVRSAQAYGRVCNVKSKSLRYAAYDRIGAGTHRSLP